MTDINEYMEEYMAEQAAKEAQARKVAQAAIDAEHEALRKRMAEARLATLRARYPIRKAIVAAAIAQGHKASTEELDAAIIINGVDVSFYLNFTEQGVRRAFRNVASGLMRLYTGTYGERTGYPPRKDGTHNYEAIARDLAMYARRRKDEQQMELNRKANAQAVNDIANAFNLPQYSSLVVPAATTGEEPMVFIDFSKLINTTVTASRARSILKALREQGVKLSYNDQ